MSHPTHCPTCNQPFQLLQLADLEENARVLERKRMAELRRTTANERPLAAYEDHNQDWGEAVG